MARKMKRMDMGSYGKTKKMKPEKGRGDGAAGAPAANKPKMEKNVIGREPKKGFHKG